MKWPIDGKIASAFSVALLSVGVLGALAYTSMTQFVTSTRWTTHAHTVLTELDDVPLQVAQAERAQLEYLLTGDEGYQATYYTAANNAEKELEEIQRALTDSPAQQEREKTLTTLTTLTKQRLANLQKAITVQDTEGDDTALDTLMTSDNGVTSADIQKVVQDMATAEKQLLAQHEAAATAHARSMRRLTAAASSLAFLLIVLAGALVNRDMLKRKRAESALTESEARYRTLVENANEGIISLTLDGKIASVNHGLETMLNWAREEVVGESYSKILTPTSATQSAERLQHALAIERLPSMYEAESVRKDGSVVPVEVRAGFLRDETGQILGLLALHRDISVRKALEHAHSDSPNALRA